MATNVYDPERYRETLDIAVHYARKRARNECVTLRDWDLNLENIFLTEFNARQEPLPSNATWDDFE